MSKIGKYELHAFGKSKSPDAVLCSDIDLGGEEWTPIGKNYSSAFKGSFE